MKLRRFLSFLFLCPAVFAAAAPWVFPNAAQPQLAAAADGRVWLAYGNAGDVWAARSDDGGETFAAPVKVARDPKLMLGLRRGPRIAAHGDQVSIVFVGSELIAFNSSDAGATWRGPIVINEVPGSAREGLHDLTVAPDGSLYVAWLDLRSKKTELWGAASSDHGRSWMRNEPIYVSPDKSICECCHPSVLYDDQGNLAVMWRNAIDGARDMWMSTRAKGADRFAPAYKMGHATWKLKACPMDGGRIVAFGEGRFGAVWQREGDVFFSRGHEPEINLGRGKQPVATRSFDGTAQVIWQQGAELVAARGERSAEPVKRASDARFASVVSVPRSGGVVLAYERGAKGATSIVVEQW